MRINEKLGGKQNIHYEITTKKFINNFKERNKKKTIQFLTRLQLTSTFIKI